MFLDKVLERNQALVDTTINLHQKNILNPDSYIIDVDAFLSNADLMLYEANKNNIDLYFMLKQVGRNPYLASKLVELGYKGAVVVDSKEARVMMKHNIPICNVGHLVQIPEKDIEKIINYGVDYITVYSYEKIESINKVCKKLNKKQNLLIRVVGVNDNIYSGQTAGFYVNELKELVDKCNDLEFISIKGITNFPCFLYDEKTNDIEGTENLKTLLEAKELLEKYGVKLDNINAPSTTSFRTIQKMADYPITSGEPGHGLSGTTPYHAFNSDYEVPAVVYLTEVSHVFDNESYCFGGGFYRRGHLKNALVFDKKLKDQSKTLVTTPDDDSIDYHFWLQDKFSVGSSVIMAFRFQMFVCRSDVYLIEGINTGKPRIIGLYNGLGDKYEQ
jgi:predicted amino acid racemase